jgi:Ca2+-transporting ATPase
MMNVTYPIEHPHSLETADVLKQMGGDANSGLDETEVRERQEKFGRNIYELQKQKSVWVILFHQFKSPIVYLLVVGAAVSFSFGDHAEGIAILTVIFINALIGFFMELQARTSMNALKKMDVIKSRVMRSGKIIEISSEEVTPGDVMYLEAGDIVAGDGRLIEVNGLQCDESSLTGESLPSEKNTNALPRDASLGDTTNMVFKGTSVVNGNGKAVVTGIASGTELGKITSLVERSSNTTTPLDKRLQSLSKRLIIVTLGMTVLFTVVSLIQGKELVLLIETAIALAVASIPEGLPIVATVALAYGVLQMARRNAIVKRLSAVETLGSTNVILTDKTGTLTENKIHVDTFALPDEKIEATVEAGQLKFRSAAPQKNSRNFELIKKVGVLCNNAVINEGKEGKSTGDPLEISLLKLARAAGEDIERLKNDHRRVGEVPFNSDSKIMATSHKAANGMFVAAKGAVEQLLLRCDRISTSKDVVGLDESTTKKILAEADTMAAGGLRVLGFAYNEGKIEGDDIAHQLIYLGMIGFLDPPRLDVRDAILSCREAGIKVVMITGDHPKTALNIAKKTGVANEDDNHVIVGKDIPAGELDQKWKEQILSGTVFARTTPQQKLDIAEVYQEDGNIVAMTGDGINDAPALKIADVGIAMGLRGTQVAKETASIVLKDDSFTTIAAAVAYGRVIFQNIQKFVMYLVSCNLSEILIVTALGILAPESTLIPLQILFLNLVTDVFPALALGVGKGDESIMKQPPSDASKEIISRYSWISIGIYAAIMTLGVVSAAIYCRVYISHDPVVINNVAFATLTFAQLLHIFNMSSRSAGLWVNEVTKNIFVWLSIAFCSGLLILVFSFDSLRTILGLSPLPPDAWLSSVAFAFVPLVLNQVFRRMWKKGS